MKYTNLYCAFCKKIISNNHPPAEKEWERFKSCRCLKKHSDKTRGGQNGEN